MTNNRPLRHHASLGGLAGGKRHVEPLQTARDSTVAGGCGRAWKSLDREKRKEGISRMNDKGKTD